MRKLMESAAGERRKEGDLVARTKRLVARSELVIHRQAGGGEVEAMALGKLVEQGPGCLGFGANGFVAQSAQLRKMPEPLEVDGETARFLQVLRGVQIGEGICGSLGQRDQIGFFLDKDVARAEVATRGVTLQHRPRRGFVNRAKRLREAVA